MPVLEDFSSTQTARITNAQGAMRVADYPVDCLSYISLGVQTGALTGVVANGAIFSFRNLASNPVMVRSIGIGFALTAAFTAPQLMSYGLVTARAFTASDTGGAAIALTGNNAKVRTSLGVLTSAESRIATTAALGAGTKTLDANHLGLMGAWAGGVGTLITSSRDNLYQHNPGDHPIILVQNEGMNILNLTAMGAAGVGVAFVNLEVAELANYQG